MLIKTIEEMNTNREEKKQKVNLTVRRNNLRMKNDSEKENLTTRFIDEY